jgi:hypothetical protein
VGVPCADEEGGLVDDDAVQSNHGALPVEERLERRANGQVAEQGFVDTSKWPRCMVRRQEYDAQCQHRVDVSNRRIRELRLREVSDPARIAAKRGLYRYPRNYCSQHYSLTSSEPRPDRKRPEPSFIYSRAIMCSMSLDMAGDQCSLFSQSEYVCPSLGPLPASISTRFAKTRRKLDAAAWTMGRLCALPVGREGGREGR